MYVCRLRVCGWYGNGDHDAGVRVGEEAEAVVGVGSLGLELEHRKLLFFVYRAVLSG